MPLTPYGKAERDSARRFVRRHYLLARTKIRSGYLGLSGRIVYVFDVNHEGGSARNFPEVVFVRLKGVQSARPRVWEFC